MVLPSVRSSAASRRLHAARCGQTGEVQQNTPVAVCERCPQIDQARRRSVGLEVLYQTIPACCADTDDRTLFGELRVSDSHRLDNGYLDASLVRVAVTALGPRGRGSVCLVHGTPCYIAHSSRIRWISLVDSSGS